MLWFRSYRWYFQLLFVINFEKKLLIQYFNHTLCFQYRINKLIIYLCIYVDNSHRNLENSYLQL